MISEPAAGAALAVIGIPTSDVAKVRNKRSARSVFVFFIIECVTNV